MGCPTGIKSQTSGEGQQAGAPSRWTVAPHPGKLGGEKRVQQEIKAASTGGIQGIDRSQVLREKLDIQNTVKIGGAGVV